MPFITEEIWQKLPLTNRVESIAIARYPERDRRLEDPAAEEEMAPVVAAIEGLRNIRGESNLPPAVRIEAHIHSASADLRQTLDKWQTYVMPLAGVNRLHVSAPAAKPALSATFVGQRMEIFVPLAGVIDLAEERARLGKEVAAVDKDLATLSRRLDNPNFVAKAPPEVVHKDRAQLEELQAKKAKLQENLRRIAPEAAMSEESKPPNGNGSPPIASMVPNPETAEVHIREPEEQGQIDLSRELKGDLESVKVPDAVDPQVKHALEKLREGTKHGLSSSDHYSLGVAYMGMGLVDDAVREFNAAKKPGTKKTAAKGKVKARAKAKAKRAVPRKAKGRSAKKAKAATRKKAPARKATRKKGRGRR
jgi:valyl-tRNA synthetase